MTAKSTARHSRNQVDVQIQRRDAKSAEKNCSQPANNLDYCSAKNSEKPATAVASGDLCAPDMGVN
jgi:hypothetical protein